MSLKEKMRTLLESCVCLRPCLPVRQHDSSGRQGAANNHSSRREGEDAKKEYEKNLKGLKRISLINNLMLICSWFLSFCALTWASAVLLGAFVQQLSKWDYYDVFLLLFIEGLRFGIAALLRAVGYRLYDVFRWALRSISFFLPLGMGGFAVLSMLPTPIRHGIQYRFAGHKYSQAFEQAPPPSQFISRNFTTSLRIFYILILSNAAVLVIGSSIIGLMRQQYVRSSVKSLCKYHDRMMQTSFNWLQPAIDYSFAFDEILGCQYRKGKDALHVCEQYADLIYFLYMDDKAVEVAEAALDSDKVFTKDAAANIVGFWAVMDTLPGVQGVKVPLCFAKGLLSKLVDIAAESYDSLGTAAAWSFLLLLDVVDDKLMDMVASVQSKSSDNEDLIDILLARTAELVLIPPGILLKQSYAHLYALKLYSSRIKDRKAASNDMTTTMFQKKIKKVFPQLASTETPNERWIDMLIKKLDDHISDYLKLEAEIHLKDHKKDEHNISNYCLKLGKKAEIHHKDYKKYREDHKKYRGEVEKWLTAPPPRCTWAILMKACFLLLLNSMIPLTCLGIGFIVNALLFKPS